MNKIFDQNITISKITLAMFVPPEGTITHKNRATHGIVLFKKGLSHFDFFENNNSSFDLNDKYFLYLPKGSNYTVIPKLNEGCFCINFDLSENVLNEKPFAFYTKNYDRLSILFEKAIRVWQKNDSMHTFQIKSILYEILAIVGKELEREYLPNKYMAKIINSIDYINNYYTKEKISIKTLAELSEMSETYFRKIFKKAYNMQITKYINTLKISYAKKLLESKLYSVEEVTTLSGFSDISIFSRTFKAYYGFSPSKLLI